MNNVCPSWSLSTKSCRLSTDGLYLPVAEHVGIYCEGGGYLSCPQSVKLDATSGLNCKTSKERRQEQRSPLRLFARVTERVGEIDQVVEGAAVTVDLSPEGFRVELCKPLSEGSEIHFSLEDASSSSPVHGKGQVQWCRSMENTSLFHAGVLITDRETSREIQRRIVHLSKTATSPSAFSV